MRKILYIIIIIITPLFIATTYGDVTYQGITMQGVDTNNAPLFLGLGDSITYGKSSSTACAGYKSFLYDFLDVQYKFWGDSSVPPADCDVTDTPIDPNYGYSCGYGTYKSADMLSRLPTCLETIPNGNTKNKIFFMLCCTNDISGNIPLATTISNMKAMVDMITASGTFDIYVAEILPRNNFEMTFSSGGPEIFDGDLIAGGTSSETGTVYHLVLDSGSWGSNTAAGRMWVKGSTTGNWITPEGLTTAGGGVATLDSTDVTSNPAVGLMNTEIVNEMTGYTGVTAVVDLNTGFNIGTMLDASGVHPNDTGYEWMAEQIADEIN